MTFDPTQLPDHLPEQLAQDAKAVEVGSGNHDDSPSVWYGAGLVMELGFIIAIPALILGFGGAIADRELDTSPLFILLGFAVSFSLSCFGVYRMIKRLAP
jgi:Putative F0F1-ATPase subunit Ca2+/Mg2+ transporter